MGPDIISYTLCDVTSVFPHPVCSDGIIHFLVAPEFANTTLAVNDENSTWQDVNVGANVLINDYDQENNTQTFGTFLDPTTLAPVASGVTVSGLDLSGSPVANAGVLTFDASGNYIFDPAPAFTGTISCHTASAITAHLLPVIRLSW